MLFLLLTCAFAYKGLEHNSRQSSLVDTDVVVVGEVGDYSREDGTWDVRVIEAHGKVAPAAGMHIRVIQDRDGGIRQGLTVTLLVNQYVPKARPGDMELVQDEPLPSFVKRAEEHFHDPQEPMPNTYFVGPSSAWKAAEPPYECPGVAIDLRGSTYLIAPANTPELARRLKERIPALDATSGVFDGWSEQYLGSEGWGHPVLLGRIKHGNALERAGLSCEDLQPFEALVPAVLNARGETPGSETPAQETKATDTP